MIYKLLDESLLEVFWDA